MSPDLIRIIIAGGLLLHGLAHGKAAFELIREAAQEDIRPAVPLRSWLLPSLSRRTTAMLAIPFWLLSGLGFIASAASFWGLILPGELWRPLAIGSAVISSLGIILFTGIWPGAPNVKLSTLDTIIGLVMNIAILVLLLAFGWPPMSMFGR